MRKWWLLLAGLVCWCLLGYGLLGRQAVRAHTPQTAPPTRIVSMGPNLTEILYALGLGPEIVGVTVDSDYPPDVAQKPKVGSFWQPNLEAIIATRPDLVVTLGFAQHRTLADRLRRMSYACLTLDIETIDGLFQGILAAGAATGTEGRAQEIVAEMRAQIAALQGSITSGTRAKVLWVVQREPLRVAGRDTFPNELIELAGGRNAIGPTLHKYPPIGAEQVLASGIDVIIEPTMVPGDEESQRAQALQYWSRWPNVPAVVNGRIYIVDGDLVSRLGPRLCEGIETVARCLRPEPLGE
ncbi:MAG: ABC transporter substrate-binding protein [Sedimentisphaerales bacterium]|nr:ABC transporter substrate-binding protein [Sedimentisphaerales bacterium]